MSEPVFTNQTEEVLHLRAEVARLKAKHRKQSQEIKSLQRMVEQVKKESARKMIEVTTEVVSVNSPQLFMDTVIREFAWEYGVPVEKVMSSSRVRPLPVIRHSIRHLIYFLSGKVISHDQITKKMNNTNHTTSLHSCETVNDWFDVPQMYPSEISHYRRVEDRVRKMMEVHA